MNSSNDFELSPTAGKNFALDFTQLVRVSNGTLEIPSQPDKAQFKVCGPSTGRSLTDVGGRDQPGTRRR